MSDDPFADAVEAAKKGSTGVFLWRGRWHYRYRDKPGDAKLRMSRAFASKAQAQVEAGRERLRGALEAHGAFDDAAVDRWMTFAGMMPGKGWLDLFRHALKEQGRARNLKGVGDSLEQMLVERIRDRQLSAPWAESLPDR